MAYRAPGINAYDIRVSFPLEYFILKKRFYFLIGMISFDIASGLLP